MLLLKSCTMGFKVKKVSSENLPTNETKLVHILALIAIFMASVAMIAIIGNQANAREAHQNEPKRLCTSNSYRIYFNETGRCYIEGKRGPCGPMMVLKRVKTSESSHIDIYGECQCMSFGPDECDSRPTVYWRAENRCYFLFDKGPCRQGQWLVVNKFNNPKCEAIQCPSKYNRKHKRSRRGATFHKVADPKFVFPTDSECNITLTQGFCPDGEIVHFSSNNFQPQCRKATQGCSTNYTTNYELDNMQVNSNSTTTTMPLNYSKRVQKSGDVLLSDLINSAGTKINKGNQ